MPWPFLETLVSSLDNATAVFAFGFIQDPAVQFVDPNGQPQRRVPYFKTEYMSDPDLVSSAIQLRLLVDRRNYADKPHRLTTLSGTTWPLRYGASELEAKIFNDTAKLLARPLFYASFAGSQDWCLPRLC
jgi:hypothetical protein